MLNTNDSEPFPFHYVTANRDRICSASSENHKKENQMRHATLRLAIPIIALHVTYASCAPTVATQLELGNLETIRRAMAEGTSVNAEFESGWTMLMYASRKGNVSSVKYLLDHGADINANSARYQNSNGWTALTFSLEFDHKEIARLLLERGANPNACVPGNYSALGSASYKGNDKMVRLLLEKGADPNACIGEYGWTPLMYASKYGNFSIVKQLVEGGADIDAIDSDGRNAVRYAGDKGYQHIVDYLNSKATPDLISAAYHGETEVVKILIENGADINERNSRGMTALMGAAINGHTESIIYLLENGSKIDMSGTLGTALMIAIRQGKTDTANLLIARGADSNVASVDGGTALMLAAVHGHADIVAKLIKNGANVNTADKHGETALWYASGEGHTDVLRQLLDNGARSKMKTHKGSTPLHISSAKGHAKIVKLLLEHGADPNDEMLGMTGLMAATFGGHLEVVRTLIESGARINEVGLRGFSALEIAKTEGHEAIAELLKTHGAIEQVTEVTENTTSTKGRNDYDSGYMSRTSLTAHYGDGGRINEVTCSANTGEALCPSTHKGHPVKIIGGSAYPGCSYSNPCRSSLTITEGPLGLEAISCSENPARLPYPCPSTYKGLSVEIVE